MRRAGETEDWHQADISPLCQCSRLRAPWLLRGDTSGAWQFLTTNGSPLCQNPSMIWGRSALRMGKWLIICTPNLAYSPCASEESPTWASPGKRDVLSCAQVWANAPPLLLLFKLAQLWLHIWQPRYILQTSLWVYQFTSNKDNVDRSKESLSLFHVPALFNVL